MTSRFRVSNLTSAEIEVIRAAHSERRPTAEVALEVGCTQRTVSKYYHRFNGGKNYQPRVWARPKSRPEKKPAPEPRPVAVRKDRFYKSDFTPS